MIRRVAACENLKELPEKEKKAKSKDKSVLFSNKLPPNNKITTDFDDFPSRESTPVLSPRACALKANG